MDLIELAVVVGLWLLFTFLGWRKRAAGRREGEPTGEWLEPEFEPQATQPGDRAGEQAPSDFRDLIRQLREGWSPPEAEEPRLEEARVEEPEVAIPLPPRPDERAPAIERLVGPPRTTSRRRSDLIEDLLHDLGSGPAFLARAVLLREILGPPVALRDESEPWSGR